MEAHQFAKTLIHTRQHISPKRLGLPGPNVSQISEILDAAGAAPDHGLTTPWHFYLLSDQKRAELGEVFANNLISRDPNASHEEVNEARGKAFRAPLLILATARLFNDENRIPTQEKMISAGCAIQNILLTAQSLGFGAGLSSGKALYSKELKNLFNLKDKEEPLCFITIGTVTTHKIGRIRPTHSSYTTTS